jgi:hypothetical protein
MPVKDPVKKRAIGKRAKAVQRKRARAIVEVTKRELGCRCAICGGIFHPCQLDFAHLDEHRSTKNKFLRRENGKKGSMGTLARESVAQFLLEVPKCRLLCANCHRLETWAGKHWEAE